MTTEAQPAQTTTPFTPRPFRRRLGWFVRGGAGLLIVVVLGVAAIRSYNMWGLPDAPEPFDVKAFEAEVVPDAENGYPFYLKAYLLLDKKVPALGKPTSRRNDPEWADLGADSRVWFDEHLPAMEIWKKGTERTYLRSTNGNSLYSADEPISWNVLRGWSQMSLVQASRLEDAGDFAGAWQWHKARLRMWIQNSRRQPFVNLWSASFMFTQYATRAQSWADHSGVTVPQIRVAIADLEAMEPLHGKRSDSLKAQYVFLNKMLDNYEMHVGPGEPRPNADSDLVLFDPLRPWIRRGKYLIAAEPERTTRTLRLLFSNWFIEADKAPADRSPEFSKSPLVFQPQPGTTPPISPGNLAWQAANAPLMRLYRDDERSGPRMILTLDDWPKVIDTNRRVIAGTIVALASRIYELETGKWPASPEQLVGPVLKKLPDNFGEAETSPAASP